MKVVLLKFLSWFLKKLLYWPFYWYGCYKAFQVGELSEFTLECAIQDDKDLNQVGKYALATKLWTGGAKPGNGHQTISAWLGMTEQNKKVSWWVKWLDKRDKGHCAKAVENHKNRIALEFKELNIK